MAHRARFAAAMAAITRRLPFGLADVVAPSLVGYLVINLCTFFLDLGLLGLFHGTFRLPLPVAVTMSYGSASVVSYVLNRVLNFRSHADVGRQFPLFVAVSASNYLIFVLGFTDLLSSLGVYYEFSRVIAACCEAVYLYCMMRWVVFRDSGGFSADAEDAGPEKAAAGDGAAEDSVEDGAADNGGAGQDAAQSRAATAEPGEGSAAPGPEPTETAPSATRTGPR